MAQRVATLLCMLAIGCARGATTTELAFDPSTDSSKDAGGDADANGPQSDAAARDAGMSLPDAATRDAGARDAGPSCGDKTCQTSETCTSCEADCGACAAGYCGDGVCQASETCSTCAVDCGSCGGLSGTDCGSCSLLTGSRESDCIGNTLYRCHKDRCLLSQSCGTRVCTRMTDTAYCK